MKYLGGNTGSHQLLPKNGEQRSLKRKIQKTSYRVPI